MPEQQVYSPQEVDFGNYVKMGITARVPLDGLTLDVEQRWDPRAWRGVPEGNRHKGKRPTIRR